jgi:ACS family hexuronate transporter-like MFS transporter
MAPGDQPLSFSRAQKILAGLLFAMMFLNYIDRQVLSILAPVMRREIALSQTGYTWAVNAFLLAYGVMYFGSGLALDRMGSRTGLAIFVGLWSIVSAMHATVRGFWDLVVWRFLLGLAEPGGWTGAVKAVSERYSTVQRGLATGIFSMGSSVALAVTPPIVVFLSLRFGWRAAFLIPSLVGLLWVPLWLRATRQPPKPGAEVEQSPALPFRQKLALLRDRRVFAYLLTRFFGDFSGYFPLFWVPDYLTTHRGFSLAMLGTLGWIPYFWNDLGPVSGTYASTRLLRRGVPVLRARKIVMTAAAALVATGAVISAAGGASTTMILASLSLSTFGVGCWAGNMHTVANDAFPRPVVASAYGLAGSAGALGGIVFNTMTGYLSARGDYWAVFLLWGILEPLGVIGLWLWLRDEDSAVPGRQT